jgi:hypothetical protein
MDGLQIFILAILGLIALVGIHRRATRSRLIRRLLEEDRSAADIEKIMGSYHKGDEDQ